MKNTDYHKRIAEYRHRREAMKALKKSGKTYQEIARTYGITKQRVYQILARAGEVSVKT